MELLHFKLYWTANTGPIYIGGHESSVSGGQGFRGCISNIRIGKSSDPIEFSRDPLIVANAIACKRSVRKKKLVSRNTNDNNMKNNYSHRLITRGDQTFPGDEDYTEDDYYAALLSEDMSDFDEDLYLERMNRIKQV